MKKTIMLVILTLAAYLFLSSFSFFISNDLIFEYGFSLSNLWGAITHPFLHIGPAHLIGNMALLLAVGLVAEKKLNWKDYYAIYFISAAAAAAVFITITQDIVLAGASAAIAGFILPACFIDLKKTIAYIILFSLTATLIAIPIESVMLSSYSQSQETSAILGENYSRTIQQKTELNENIAELDDKFKKGEITITEYNQTKQELEETVENIIITEQEVAEELNKTTEIVAKLEEGIVRQETSSTSTLVHLAGSFAGLAYLALFRRDLIWDSGYQVLKLERWLKKHLKKSRKRTSRKSSR